ncbi:DUF29 family protein, partial [Thermocrinis sp.]|uniref:DUF29 family protein n=1 Tax=Thermocrinis sp. TaxID=2024383 RepID=UPI002FDCB866
KISQEMGNSWIKSIINARLELSRLYRKNPSLVKKSEEELQEAWEDAIKSLIGWFKYPENKTIAKRFFGRLPTEKDFPSKCPYTFEQVLEYEPWIEEI